jgi:hypothetical protein
MLDDEKKLEGLLALYKEARESFRHNVGIEWRIVLFTWVGVAVFTGFAAGKITANAGVGAFYVAIWLVFSGFWTAVNWYHSEHYMRAADSYLNEIDCLLERAEPRPIRPPASLQRFLTDKTRLVQIGTTGLLLAFSWYVLHLAHP